MQYYIDLQSRLKRLGRNQRYLAKVFRKPESHISLAIHGSQYKELLEKIVKHIEKLETHSPLETGNNS